MLVAELHVTRNCIEVVQHMPVTRGLVGAAVSFTFSPEWEGLSKTAVFRTSREARDVVNIRPGQPVAIPWEVTRAMDRELTVGVCGCNGSDTVVPTVWGSLGPVEVSAVPAEVPAEPPTPDWAGQIQNQTDQAVTQASQARRIAEQLLSSEEQRQQAEEQRRLAESERGRREALRRTAEQQREEARADLDRICREAREAEQFRVDQEKNRAAEEKIRAEAEQQRNDGEKNRCLEEKRRVLAEHKRQNLIDDQSLSVERTWSSACMVENFCPEFHSIGALVACHPAVSYPLEIISLFSAQQEGQGEPGPQNVRPVKMVQRVSMRACRENLWICERSFGEADCLQYDADAQTYTVRSSGKSFDGSICKLTGAIPAGTELRLTVYFEQGRTEGKNSVITVGTGNSAQGRIWQNLVRVPVNRDLKGQTVSSFLKSSTDITDLYLEAVPGQEIREDVKFRVMLTVGELLRPYEPCSLTEFTQALPQGIYSGSYNWKTGELKSENSFFTLPPRGAWTEYEGKAMRLKLADYGYTDQGGAMCENRPIGTVPGQHSLALPGDGYVYLPFRTREEVRMSLEAEPIRLLLKQQRPNGLIYSSREYLGQAGTHYISSSTGTSAVNGYEDLHHAIRAIRNQLSALEVRSGGEN